MPRSSTSDGHAAIPLRIAQEMVQRCEVQDLRSFVRGLIENSVRREVLAEQDGQEFLRRLEEAESPEEIRQVGEELLEAGYVPAFMPRDQLEQISQGDTASRDQRPADAEAQRGEQESERPETRVIDHHQPDWETRAHELEDAIASLRREIASLRQAENELTGRVNHLQKQLAELQTSQRDNGHTDGKSREEDEKDSTSDAEALTIEELDGVVVDLDLDVDWEDYEFPVIIRGRDEKSEPDTTE